MTVARRKQKRNTTTDAGTPWEGAAEVETPNPQSPANQKQAKWRKRYRIVAWASLIGMPIVLVVDLSLASTMMDPNFGKEDVTVTDQVDSVGKSAAWVQMQSWLATEPSPLPGATIISWDGYQTKEQDHAVASQILQAWGERDYKVELHRFTLSASGQLYSAEVTIAVDGNGQSEVIGTPSALPIAPSSTGWSTKGAWMNVVETTKTDAMAEAVDNWAKAYISGDSTTLRLAVGDPDSSHTYMPLTGATAVKTQVTRAGYVPQVTDKTVVNQEHPDTVIAQVELKFTWDGQSAQEVDAKGKGQTMDVLIKNANTASPKVVAWGAVGTGPDLTEYQNAVTGRQIKSDQQKQTNSSQAPSLNVEEGN